MMRWIQRYVSEFEGAGKFSRHGEPELYVGQSDETAPHESVSQSDRTGFAKLKKLLRKAEECTLIAFGKPFIGNPDLVIRLFLDAADASQSGNPVWRLGAGLHGLSDTARGFPTCLLSRLGKGLGVIITRYT